jgi:hypothetical protein
MDFQRAVVVIGSGPLVQYGQVGGPDDACESKLP